MAGEEVLIKHVFVNPQPDDAGPHVYTFPSDWNAAERLSGGTTDGDVVTWAPGAGSKASFRTIAAGSGISVVITAGAITISTSVSAVSGSGTTGKLPKWASSTTLTNSIVTEGVNAITVQPLANSTSTLSVKKLSGFEMFAVNTSGSSIFMGTESVGTTVEIDTDTFYVKSYDAAKQVVRVNAGSAPQSVIISDVLQVDADAATVASTLFLVRKLTVLEYFRVDTTGIRLGTYMTLYNNAAPTNGQLLIGNTASARFDAATLTAGSGVSIVNGAGSITISATGTLSGSGTTDRVAKWSGATALGDSNIVSLASGIVTIGILGTPAVGNILRFAETVATAETFVPRIHQTSAGTPQDLAIGAGSTSGQVRFYTGALAAQTDLLGAGANAERMRISPAGVVTIGRTSGHTIGSLASAFSYVQLNMTGLNDQTGTGFNAEGLGVFTTLKPDVGALAVGIVSHVTYDHPASGTNIVAGIYAEPVVDGAAGAGVASEVSTVKILGNATFGTKNYALLMGGRFSATDPSFAHSYGADYNTAIGHRFHTTAPASNGDGATVAMSLTGTLTTTANNEIMAGLFMGYTANLTFATGTATGLSASMMYLDGARMSKTGTGTITNAATVRIVAEPNAISTNQYALWVESGRVLVSDAQKHSFGGAWKTYSGITFRGSISGDATNGLIFGYLFEPSIAPSSGDIAAVFGIFNGATITKVGTNPVIAGMYLSPPTLTGGGTATLGATAYIGDGTTGATTNYALYVDSGVSRFNAIMRVTGAGGTVGSVGAGIELRGSATPSLTAYNRATSAYLTMIYDAAQHTFTTGKLFINLNSEGLLFTPTTGTAGSWMRFTSTGADSIFGIENSAGGNIFTGTSAYAGVFGNVANTDMQFATNNTLRMTLSAAGGLFLGGTADARYIFRFTGSFSSGGAATNRAAAMIDPTYTPGVGEVGRTLALSPSFVESASGNHDLLAGLYIYVGSVSAGAATVTDTASLYVAGAMAATVSGANYAMWVDAGTVRMDGVLSIGASAAPPSSVDLFVKNTAGVTVRLVRATDTSGLEFAYDDSAGYISTSTTTPMIFRTNGAEIFRIFSGGGMSVGSTAQTDKGNGTINVQTDVYKAGTAYTNPDYVFEKWATGDIGRFANKEGAAQYRGLKALSAVETFVRDEYQLPLMAESRNRGVGLFGGGDALLASVEESYLYLFDHEARIARLEDELADLKSRR